MVKINRVVLMLLVALTLVSGVAIACNDAPQYAAASCSGYPAAHFVAVASCSAPAASACYAPAVAAPVPVAPHVHHARWFPGKRIGQRMHARQERRQERRAARHVEHVTAVAVPVCAVEYVAEPPAPDCGD